MPVKTACVHFEITFYHDQWSISWNVCVDCCNRGMIVDCYNRGKLISTILDWEDALPDRDLNRADDASR